MNDEQLRDLLGMAYQWVGALAAYADELKKRTGSTPEVFTHPSTQKMMDMLGDPDAHGAEEAPVCPF